MTIKEEVLRKVGDTLPYGSAKLIYRRLVEKNICHSYQYVWRCLNIKCPDVNFDVLKEAGLLSNELKAQKKEKRRMLNIANHKRVQTKNVV